MANRYVISGKKLSELPAGFPSADSKFLLALSAVNDYSLTYGNLSADLSVKLNQLLGFKSMAQELSIDWAFSSHLHNYSKLTVEPLYGVDGPVAGRTADVSTIFNLTVSDETNTQKTYSIAMPVEELKLPDVYKIGEMRFLALPQSKLTEIGSVYFGGALGTETNPRGFPRDDFDGWVYADGKFYTKDAFPEAYELYKDMVSPRRPNTFKVPDFSTFVTANPNTAGNGLGRQGPTLGLKPHAHTVSSAGNSSFSGGKLNVNCTISCYSTGGYSSTTGYQAHSSSGNTERKPITALTCTADMSKFELSLADRSTNTVGSASATTEIYPTFNFIPAMVYIGRGSNNG